MKVVETEDQGFCLHPPGFDGKTWSRARDVEYAIRYVDDLGTKFLMMYGYDEQEWIEAGKMHEGEVIQFLWEQLHEIHKNLPDNYKRMRPKLSLTTGGGK